MSDIEQKQITELIAKVDHLTSLIEGRDGSLGLASKVSIMWRAHVWLLCTFSAIVGSGMTALVLRVMS